MYRSKQKGSVLIISLVLLLVLTILGISSIDNTTMEEKMAGNLYQRNLGFQSAEAALRVGEEDLLSLNKDEKITPSNDGSSGIWVKDEPGTDGTKPDGSAGEASSAWYRSWDVEQVWLESPCEKTLKKASECGGGDTYHGVFKNIETDREGYYLVEYDKRKCDSLVVGQQVDQQSCLDYYNMTALGLGPGRHAKVYLRSSIARRY